MCETSLSVWFVCRLCRGSFGQVDTFIEHKKEKHFNEFQNTTCIVFEESEHGLIYPGTRTTDNGDHELANEGNEPRIKIEVNNEDPMIPFSSEIIDEPNLDLVDPKSELITFECEINPENENNFFALEQPEQNPHVLLKRLTSEEIQTACVLQHHSTLLKYEQKSLANGSDPCNSSNDDSNTIDYNEIEKSTEIEQTTPNVRISTEGDLQFECKLCSKQFQSEAQLKIHVGICALYHEDQIRFCVICNKKFSNSNILKRHRLRFHGTEEEKSSLYKFKCHLCPKKYQNSLNLRFHIESHDLKKQIKTSKCSQPNCGKEFLFNSELQRHISTVHFGLRPFSCSFPKCNKSFSQRSGLNIHFRTHTGERPYKCKVNKCNQDFISASRRSKHHQSVHRTCNL